MKIKSLVIIAVLVVGCSFASAQTFGFASVGGGLFCNYEQLQQLAPYRVWQGVDNLSVCGLSRNAVIVGATGSITATANPGGFHVEGVMYADNIYDASSGAYTGAQWFAISNLKCSSRRYGWIGFAGVSGVIFGDNYGYLTCEIPGRGAAATRGLSTGNSKVPTKK